MPPQGTREANLPPYHPGALLEQHRVNLGLTISEAAKLAGMKDQTWSRIERGLTRHPEWTTMCRMLAALGLKVDMAYDREPDLGKLHDEG